MLIQELLYKDTS